MALSAGSKLGPYEIVSPLGAGGMGEVYRARDTRLDRTVAIKVLRSALVATPDAKARFEREARAISALQHPNICVLHDVGHEGEVDFLVMEFLDGETLADRIKNKGALPLNELIKIGCEIADALDKAHRAGIVHRDLKPGNIMLTKTGAKLLDFGLAKPAAVGAAATSGSAPLLSAAMTVTSPTPQHSPLTQQGSLVGTVQYMSPEQIQGIEADARSDIFAFGALLYEIATGKRAFDGKSQIKVASAILEDEPPRLAALQPALPPSLDRLVRACLAKNPDERLQSVRDVAIQLQWIRESGNEPANVKNVPASRTPVWIASALAAVVIAIASWLLISRTHGTPVYRAEISPPEQMTFETVGDGSGVPALSPGGDMLAFVARDKDGHRSLWVRPLNQLEARRLDGTDDASHPFWSPDGKYLGFFAGGKLDRVAVSGGPVTPLADVVNPRGGSWGTGGVILFAADFRAPLSRVSADGGSVTPATVMDSHKHTTHRWPWFLPDGKHFLYFANNHAGGRREDNGIYFGSLDGEESHLVVATDAAAQYASGYLLYHSQTAIVAQPFDARTGRLSGDAIPIINKVRNDSGVWRSVFSASDTGALAYQPGTSSSLGTQMAWYDRTGKQLSAVGARENHADLSLSPDGKQLVYASPNSDLWITDLQKGTNRRLTFNEGAISEPSWFPDGKTIVYTVAGPQGAGALDIRSRAANGTGAARTLSTERHNYRYPAISPDGKYLAYIVGEGTKRQALWAVPLEGDRKPFVVVAPPTEQANIMNFKISPNGRWVVYQSDESQQSQVYVAPFPKGDGKWQVSTGGGTQPSWRGDSKEIFFKTANDEFFAAPVTEHDSDVDIGTPKPLFRVFVSAVGTAYSVSPDGQRFVINKSEEEGSAPLYLVTDWTAELKK